MCALTSPFLRITAREARQRINNNTVMVCSVVTEHGLFSRIRLVASVCTAIKYLVTWVQESLHHNDGISIDLAIFAGFTRVTDRQTDHATCDICSNSPLIKRAYLQVPRKYLIMLVEFSNFTGLSLYVVVTY